VRNELRKRKRLKGLEGEIDVVFRDVKRICIYKYTQIKPVTDRR